MAINDVLPKLRQDRNMTQQELAAKLFVTRQAVSRWENGETTPSIDMAKLIATVLDVPIMRVLDGTENPNYCKWCYDEGEFASATMDDVIEKSAPYLMQATGVSLDEAVSFMGALLPSLKRWKSGE